MNKAKANFENLESTTVPLHKVQNKIDRLRGDRNLNSVQKQFTLHYG